MKKRGMQRPPEEETPALSFFLGAGCQYYAFTTVLFDSMVSCGIGD